jgi:hypothetical protein
MDRIRWEEHKGKKILILDYSGLHAIKPEEKKELLETIQKAVDLSATLTTKACYLTIATDGQADNDVLGALKEFAAFTNKKQIVEKECVVGITGIQKILLNAINLFSGGKLRPFDTVEEAKDWLAE